MTRHVWQEPRGGDGRRANNGYLHECRRCGALAQGPFSCDDFNRPASQDAWLARYENRGVDPDCDVELVGRVLRM